MPGLLLNGTASPRDEALAVLDGEEDLWVAVAQQHIASIGKPYDVHREAKPAAAGRAGCVPGRWESSLRSPRREARTRPIPLSGTRTANSLRE